MCLYLAKPQTLPGTNTIRPTHCRTSNIFHVSEEKWKNLLDQITLLSNSINKIDQKLTTATDRISDAVATMAQTELSLHKTIAEMEDSRSRMAATQAVSLINNEPLEQTEEITVKKILGAKLKDLWNSGFEKVDFPRWFARKVLVSFIQQLITKETHCVPTISINMEKTFSEEIAEKFINIVEDVTKSQLPSFRIKFSSLGLDEAHLSQICENRLRGIVEEIFSKMVHNRLRHLHTKAIQKPDYLALAQVNGEELKKIQQGKEINTNISCFSQKRRW